MVVMTGFSALAHWKTIGAGVGRFKPPHRGRGSTGDAARLIHPKPTPCFCCPGWCCAGLLLFGEFFLHTNSIFTGHSFDFNNLDCKSCLEMRGSAALQVT